MATSPASATVTAEDVERARHAIADVAKRTPVLPSLTLTQRAGGEVALKAENLQRTGSFKIRGALNKLAALGDGVRAGGHGGQRRQPRAGAGPGGARARRAVRGLHAGRGAAVARSRAARALGAVVHRGGTSVEECVAAAKERAREAGMAFVHPFDDPDVVAGQGTLGLELLDDVPDLAKVVVPGGRRRAGQRRRHRGEVRAPGRRGRRGAGRHRRLLSRVAAPRRARRGRPGR